MGFSESKFLALPAKSRAKKLADLLRVILLRLGNDWKQGLAEYDQLVTWHCPENIRASFLLGKSQQHARVLDLYQHWREQAGLGLERDVYLQQDPGDLSEAPVPPLEWAVLAHNLRSAYNVGSLIRSVDCFGLQGVHLSGYTPDIDHAALRSAARGAESWIPTQRWDSPLDCIQHFRDQGAAIIALETGDDSVALGNYTWPTKGLIVLGNEELGIAPELLQCCTQKISIPMYGRKASLNVASAFAITVAFLRQQQKQGNALAMALLVLVIATVLATAIMTGTGSTSIQATKRLHALQAQYLAESAIRLKSSSYPWTQSDTANTPNTLLAAFPALPPVEVDSSTLWLRLNSTATFREASVTVHAEIGRTLSPEGFGAAIMITAPQAPTDASNLRILGKLLVGNQSNGIGAARVLEQFTKLSQKLWLGRRNQFALAFHQDSLKVCSEICQHGNQSFSRISDFPESLELRVIEGDLRMDLGFTGTPSVLSGNRLFFVQGDVLLRGNIRADSITILSSGTITIEGAIQAQQVTLVSENKINLTGDQRYQGLVMAQGDINIADGVHLIGNSFLIASRPAPDPETGDGHIRIGDRSEIQGWIAAITPTLSNVILSDDAIVRGIVLAANGIQNAGSIYGAAISSKLLCTERPSENCGGAGKFFRDSLPGKFVQPIGLDIGARPYLAVVRWSVR